MKKLVLSGALLASLMGTVIAASTPNVAAVETQIAVSETPIIN